MKTPIYVALIIINVVIILIYIKFWPRFNTIISKYFNLRFSNKSKLAKLSFRTFQSKSMDEMRTISKFHEKIINTQESKIELPNAVEWLYDNYLSVQEKYDGIINDNFRVLYVDLYKFQYSHTSKIRVYDIALEIINSHDGRLNDKIITNYLFDTRKHTNLTEREIDILPKMLLVALIHNISKYTEELEDILDQWHLVNQLIIDDQINETAIESSLKKLIRLNSIPNPHFVIRLYEMLRESGDLNDETYELILELFAKIGTDVTEVINYVNNSEVYVGLQMENLITSLKNHSFIKWSKIQKKISIVSQILNQDPAGMYEGMAFETQLSYRKKVAFLSEHSEYSEVQIAKMTLELARKANYDPELDASDLLLKNAHVGYYLMDEGEKVLRGIIRINERKVQARYKVFDLKERTQKYLLLVLTLTLFLVFSFTYFLNMQIFQSNMFNTIASILILLIPMSECSIYLINLMTTTQTRPHIFPRLSLDDGIDESMSTLVIVPALLSSVEDSKSVLKSLEQHYLLNRDNNLHFAIVGAYKDADSEHLDTDQAVFDYVLQSIEALNVQYGGKFFFFHRKRVYNKSNNIYIGWERKRGALIELNRFLLGDTDTSFIHPVALPQALQSVKYVITLDADTVLPMQAAKKMIEVMEHPLNRPIIDKERNIVTEGYGILQPLINTSLESASKSLFSRLFNQQLGFSTYSNRSSNLYQDYFKEGIFMGKGIYHLRVFHELLDEQFLDNTVLSHDLIEGAYLRAAFVSDIYLVDDYPNTYTLDASRHYRWVRGDWQLLGYLRKTLKDNRDRVYLNPLSSLSKWKLTDNLRRSLIAPTLMLVIFLSFTNLVTYNTMWLVCALVIIYLPSIHCLLIAPYRLLIRRHRLKDVFTLLITQGLQNTLTFINLPFEAAKNTKAILVTLTRVFVTKSNLLQWTTSSAMSRSFKNSLIKYVMTMRSVYVQILILVLLYMIYEPFSLIYLILMVIVWGSAPLINYQMGLPLNHDAHSVTSDEKRLLGPLARKTWLYFETFANAEFNDLIPDNYQVSPYKSADARTSPTNIGLQLCAVLSAFDLGYIEHDELLERTDRTLRSIESLDKWNGHLFNWYNINNLKPIHPIYVSTVDSGNLVGYLITLKEGVLATKDRPFCFSSFKSGFEDTVSCIKTADLNTPRVQFDNLLQTEGDVSILYMITEIQPRIENWMNSQKYDDAWYHKAAQRLHVNIKSTSDLKRLYDEILQVPVTLHDSNLIANVMGLLNTKTQSFSLSAAIDSLEGVLGLIDASVPSNNDEKEWLKQFSNTIEDCIVAYKQRINLTDDIVERLDVLYTEMDFSPLYDPQKKLFSIGFNIDLDQQSNSFYDLLASEARQASYISIAKGDVPSSHWNSLGRSLVDINHRTGLLSWTGTMFEYLMPSLIMPSYKHTMLDKTLHFAVKTQIDYGTQEKIPWGLSESQYYSFDNANMYQYRAIGVPALAISTKVEDEKVVSPYSTLLALSFSPKSALENIKRLKHDGLSGVYGLYEAVDYDHGPKIVRTYMAHHQGMSLLAINNYLNENIMQQRFMSNPAMGAYNLLLEEQIPNVKGRKKVVARVKKEKVSIKPKQAPAVRAYNGINLEIPKVHIMTNGNYSMLLNDQGGGYSKIRNTDITRWREGQIENEYGTFFMIEQMSSGLNYSASYAPLNSLGEDYKVVFESHKTTFTRRDGMIDSKYEIAIPYEDNIEIRKLTLENTGDMPETLSVLSYLEPILTGQSQDRSHKTFSNLFIETEVDKNTHTMLAKRRSTQDSQEQITLAQRLIVSDKFKVKVDVQTDRSKVIARNTNLGMRQNLTKNDYFNNVPGAVLDPVLSSRVEFVLKPTESIYLSYVTMVSENSDTLTRLLTKFKSYDDIKYALLASSSRDLLSSKYSFLKENEIIMAQNILSHLVYSSPLRAVKNDKIRILGGKKVLWKFGVSGDNPIVTVLLSHENQIKLLIEILHAQQYWQMLGYKVDVIVLNMSAYSYINELSDIIQTVIQKHTYLTIFTEPCTVISLHSVNLDEGDVEHIKSFSRLCLDGKLGTLAKQGF